VVAPFQALLQPVPTPEALARASRILRVGDSSPVEALAAWLAGLGMARVEVVEVAGEFSLRGGILDVFPPDLTEPVRIEFFGDDVESIRPFDPETQRSLGRWDSVCLAAVPPLDGDRLDDLGPLTAYLPAGTWVALVEPADLKEEGATTWAGPTTPAASTPWTRPSPGCCSTRRSRSRPWRPTRWRRPATCGSRASSGSPAS
jgi:transcription-repair coupling factor (superfamily II helicase)